MLADRRGSTALEFALCFPAVLLMVFGTFAIYSLISCWRAMDVGIERALRYAVVHGGGGTAEVVNRYNAAAANIWPSVGTASTVTVTPAAFKAGDVVTVNVSYVWGAPATIGGPPAVSLFTGVTLVTQARMRVIN